jgi:DNA-binding CsgD family transcriptional regulator
MWLNTQLLTAANSRRLAALQALNPHKREVRRWLAEGKSNPEIATILVCSTATNKKHCENMCQKRGLENINAAILSGLRAHPAE